MWRKKVIVMIILIAKSLTYKLRLINTTLV